MKKLLCLILAALILFLASCSSVAPIETEEETATKNVTETKQNKPSVEGSFAVGFSRQKFTPTGPIPLAGYGGYDQRLCTNVLDNVCATCIAVQDETGNKALIFTLDLCLIMRRVADRARTMLSDLYGVPRENIILSATHTHSGPATQSRTDDALTWISKVFYESVRIAAEDALNDLDKTEIYQGDVKLENMNFVRRYKNSAGKWMQDSADGTPVQHESEADNSMQIIKFDRENSQDIVMVNWQAHPTFNGGETKGDISADYPHYLRKAVESEGYLCGFWQGAAGNINFDSKLPDETKYNPESASEYGKALANSVIEALPKLEKANTGLIKAKEKTLTLTVDHSKDALAAKGKEILDLLNAGKLNEAKALFPKYGFVNLYEGRDIYNKSIKDKTVEQNISAIAFGDLAFVSFPFEMFDTNGMQIKEGSPYTRTFICELSNGWDSYYPSSLAFDHGGYEVTSFYYVKGTSEMISDELVAILNDFSK